MTKYYVVYDTTTCDVVTRYDSDINNTQIANLQTGTALLEVADQATMLQTCNGNWTVVNGALIAPPAPTAAQLLQAAQAAQIVTLTAAYNAAILAPVTVTLASGTAASFATDAQSITKLNEAIAANAANGTWQPNFWYTSTGSTVSPVTYADLHTIAQAIQGAEVPDIQNLHAKIGEVVAATTPAAVSLITWS